MNFFKKREKKDYKGFVGPANLYNEIGQIIFDLLLTHGLKKNNTIMDIGAGSLRVGKLLIPWLHKGKYKAIEPEKWLVDEAFEKEIDEDVIIKKAPEISNNIEFVMDFAGENFDFILANSIFIHASLSQICQCIENVKEKMKESSVFIFNFIPGKDSKNTEWTYPGAVTYKKETIFEILEKNEMVGEIIPCKYPGKQIFVKAKLK